MRACEFTKTASTGRTKRIALQDVVFRDRKRRRLNHNDPRLTKKAKFVSITFRNQKNGKKNDTRSMRCSGHHYLCPVLRYISAVQRILNTIPNFSPTTQICSFQSPMGTRVITSMFMRDTLRHVCTIFGGAREFGMQPTELGTRSIRSGAAMALFIMDHSPAKIMILGRWSSDAFLVYIRPQVIEWTNVMSRDMIEIDSYLDSTACDTVSRDDPRLRKRLLQSLDGQVSMLVTPRFHLYH